MIKNILFDLDGTLIDSAYWHYVALNKALQKICWFSISLEDHINHYNALPTKVKLSMLEKKWLIQSNQFNEIQALKQQYTIEQIKLHCKPNDRYDLLKYLKEWWYIVWCVTNCIKLTTIELLQKTNIIQFFDVIIDTDMIAIPKPDPESYKLALTTLNITAEETLVIQDTLKWATAWLLSWCNVRLLKSHNDLSISTITQRIK